MAVSKRRGSWWVDFRFRRTRYRRKSPEDSKRGAEAYEILLKKKLLAGEPIDAQKVEVKPKRPYEAFSKEWFKTYVETNNKPSEQRKKESILRVHLLPYFGDMELENIDSLTVERYKTKKLATGISPKSINNHLTTLRKSLSCAKDWGYIDRLPTIKWLKAPSKKITFLTQREINKLLSDEKEPLWNMLIFLGLNTGMRIGEMVALHWEDVNFQEQRICVRYSMSENQLSSPKNNRIRYIPMNMELSEYLREWKRVSQGRKKGMVCQIKGVPISHFSVHHPLERICKRVGVRRIGWHVLRHTFATRLCAKQVPLRAVQELLGHSTILMTERYAHVGETTLRQAVAVLNGETQNFGHYMVTNLPSMTISPTKTEAPKSHLPQ